MVTIQKVKSESETLEAIKICQEYNVIPSLSCGMNPVLARELKRELEITGWHPLVDGYTQVIPLYDKVKEMRESLD